MKSKNSEKNQNLLFGLFKISEFFWILMIIGIILESSLINSYGKDNTMLWLILSLIGWEVSKLTND
ncbi:hypothetical protein LCGC14_0730100 [marine sediment metagenome]|uniref:Uncharacterized protein n=1 Tax=marine sediment metagenome TaxID=412755 RepID=A0A0F9QE62_9ZZZZ